MTSSPREMLDTVAQLSDQLAAAMTDLRALRDGVPSAEVATPNDLVGVRFPFDDAPGFPQITVRQNWSELISPEELGGCITSAVRDNGSCSASSPTSPPPPSRPSSMTDINDVNDMLRRLNEAATRSGRAVEQLARWVPAGDATGVAEPPGTLWGEGRQVGATVLTGQVTAIHVRPAWAADRSAVTIASAVNEVVVTALEQTSRADRSDPDRPFADPCAAVRILQEHL